MIFLTSLLSETWFCTLFRGQIDGSWFHHQRLWILLMVTIKLCRISCSIKCTWLLQPFSGLIIAYFISMQAKYNYWQCPCTTHIKRSISWLLRNTQTLFKLRPQEPFIPTSVINGDVLFVAHVTHQSNHTRHQACKWIPIRVRKLYSNLKIKSKPMN